MKFLYVTTIGSTMNFFKDLIKELIEEGHTVDIATNESIKKVPDFYRNLNCKIYSIECTRSPFNKGNIHAIRQIKQLVENNQYDIVHCHTPIAAMCTRVACRKLRKKGLKVFYTAHGFHFYKGAPLKNWLMYYPIEWLCAFFTDAIITINKEDYALAKKHMHAKRVEYVPGVGIDVAKFSNTCVDRKLKRQELGIPEDAFLLLSVGELNENKNHQVIIKALAKLNNPDIHYAIAGVGNMREYLLELANKLGVSKQIHLLGYRKDVAELNCSADVFCFPSYREGLGLAAIEAMACGLPLITSNVHGINDYSVDGITGYKCSPDDVEGFAKAISCLNCDYDLRNLYAMNNSKLVEKYNLTKTISSTIQLYLKL